MNSPRHCMMANLGCQFDWNYNHHGKKKPQECFQKGLTKCLSYFAIAVKRHHNRSNL